MFHHLFICFLLLPHVIVHHQAIVSVCSSIEGVHRLCVVSCTGLLSHSTVKGPVLLCLDKYQYQHGWADTCLFTKLKRLNWTIPVSWQSLQSCRSVFWCSPKSLWGLTWRSPWSLLSVWVDFQPWSGRTCTDWPYGGHTRTTLILWLDMIDINKTVSKVS